MNATPAWHLFRRIVIVFLRIKEVNPERPIWPQIRTLKKNYLTFFIRFVLLPKPGIWSLLSFGGASYQHALNGLE